MSAVLLPYVSTAPVESPEWWRDRLLARLERDRKVMDLWWRYHTGDHPAPELPEKINDKLLPAYNAMLRRSRSNFMRMTNEAYTDRMRPIGFWLGGDDDAARDELSWQIWQASQLDRDIHMALAWALGKGRSYLSVWHHEDDEFPRIAVENPTQCIVEHAAGSRHRRRAALKLFRDDVTAEDVAQLYLRGEVPNESAGCYEFRRRATTGASQDWEESGFFANPLGVNVVPIIPLYNRPETDPGVRMADRPVLVGGGDAEIADLTYIQDRINETIFNGKIAEWASAFKQKWATGLIVDKKAKTDSNGDPVLDDDGTPVMIPVEPYDLGSDRLLVAEDREVKFGEFSASDQKNFTVVRERELEDLTIVSRIPRHYLIQQGQAPSGDSMVSAEVGFVGRIKRKLDDFGEDIEEAVGIARSFAGLPPMPVDAELRWDDPENQSLAQKTDAVIKEYSAGLITRHVALERLNYSPPQIARMDAERVGEDLLLEAAAPAPLEPEVEGAV